MPALIEANEVIAVLKRVWPRVWPWVWPSSAFGARSSVLVQLPSCARICVAL